MPTFDSIDPLQGEPAMPTAVTEVSTVFVLLVIAGTLLFLIALIFSLRAKEFSWPNIAVMSLGIVSLMLPSIQKFSLSKDSISFEQFQIADKSKDALEGLQKAAQENSNAIGLLSGRVDELAKVTNQMLASTAAEAPNKSALSRISEDTQKIGTQVKNNDKTLDEVRKKNEIINQLLIR